ncbi:MAG: hypothetical protein ACKV22_31515 [Bryobacteraceae bacterium]
MTLSWCLVDEAKYSRAAFAALQTTFAVVPAVWRFEIANGLSIAERRKSINQDNQGHYPLCGCSNSPVGQHDGAGSTRDIRFPSTTPAHEHP